MKTKEELNKLKTEYESLNKKLAELTDEEISIVCGGVEPEEFFWRPEGYYTPKKDKTSSDSEWPFEAIGNAEGKFFNKKIRK